MLREDKVSKPTGPRREPVLRKLTARDRALSRLDERFPYTATKRSLKKRRR